MRKSHCPSKPCEPCSKRQRSGEGLRLRRRPLGRACPRGLTRIRPPRYPAFVGARLTSLLLLIAAPTFAFAPAHVVHEMVGRMLLATIDDPTVIRRILTHLGLSLDNGDPSPGRGGMSCRVRV